jgi:glutamine synthetase
VSDTQYVLLALPDVNGYLRGKALRRTAFDAAVDDGTVMTDLLLGLDPVDTPISDYEGFGIRSGAGDLLVRPDSDTLHELTWRFRWSVCLGTPYWRDGSACELAPREVLGRALEAVEELGYAVRAAFEYEVRIWDGNGQPLSSGISYSIVEAGRYHELVSALEPALAALGVELSAVHTEAGPGLLELNLAPGDGLKAADDAAYVKLAVKGVAQSLGLRASFLAKTAPDEEGSSGHLHVSLWRNGTNAFAPDGEQEAGLPAPLVQSTAGVLEHLPGASLVLNPTINSYKRLVPGWFAPTNASWGLENRSTALRVISSPHADRCRIECRRPGADANPYLVLAAVLVSAADGLRREAEPPAPVVGDAYARDDLPALPGSLESALAAFAADESLRSGLGEAFSDYYATSREWELRAWRESVSDWERVRYERAV